MAVTSSGTAKVTLPADDQILITREFDAPRELVFKAWTTPELVARWWSGERGKVTSIDIDLRVGGKWRYVMEANEGGFEVAFHGEYSEIVPSERLVSTEVYEGIPDADDRAAAAAPPALDQLGRGPRLEDQLPGGVELARDEDLILARKGHLRRPTTRHCHLLAPSV